MEQEQIEAKFIRVAHFMLGMILLGFCFYILKQNSYQISSFLLIILIIFLPLSLLYLYLSLFGSDIKLEKWSSTPGLSEISAYAYMPALILSWLWMYLYNKWKKS